MRVQAQTSVDKFLEAIRTGKSPITCLELWAQLSFSNRQQYHSRLLEDVQDRISQDTPDEGLDARVEKVAAQLRNFEALQNMCGFVCTAACILPVFLWALCNKSANDGL